MIRRIRQNGRTKYRVESETTGRNLGTYTTKTGAEKRRKQVEMFKHMKHRRSR